MPNDDVKTKTLKQFCVNLEKKQRWDLKQCWKLRQKSLLVYRRHMRFSKGRESIEDDELRSRAIAFCNKTTVELDKESWM